ncbi:MAG TPA: MFS transporter [Chloroflexia bacterium]|nr:MFS transporter [Chloroflexia bacterium]
MLQVSSTQPAALLRRARLAVIVFFMLHGLLFASWIVRIPDVKAHLGLSNGELGLALLGAPVGAIAGQFLVGWLLGKYGSKPITVVMAVTWCFLFPLLGLAPHMLVLLVVLFFYGLLSGGMDVAMNAQAASVEKRYGRPIMASFHGTWSIASLSAAGIGGFLAGQRVAVELHFVVVALLVLLGVGFAQRWLIREGQLSAGVGNSFGVLPRSLFALGMLAFCVLLVEGAISDWSAVYLREAFGSPPTEAAAAFVAFSLLMTIGRLTGDYLTLRFGPARIVQGGGLLALAGLLLFVLSPLPFVAIAGCALIGAGIACPFPLVISAAARNSTLAPGRAISAMATVGYCGTLLGPPLIGTLAELFSLRGALTLLCLAALSLLLAGGQVEPQDAAKLAIKA